MREAFANIEAISQVSSEVLTFLEGTSGDLSASYAVLAGHGLGFYQHIKHQNRLQARLVPPGGLLITGHRGSHAEETTSFF